MPLARFRDWPLRRKMLALLLVSSALPLAVATYVTSERSRQTLDAISQERMEIAADGLRETLDAFNAAHASATRMCATLPVVVRACEPPEGDAGDWVALADELVRGVKAADPARVGATVLDRELKVLASTFRGTIGRTYAFRPFLREALAGSQTVSDVVVTAPEADAIPVVVHAAPVRSKEGRVIGLAVIAVDAKALWRIIESAEGAAGEGSSAVLLDRFGIRIGHGRRPDYIFRPAGTLPPDEIETLVREQRFGEGTRQYLESPVPNEEAFRRARAGEEVRPARFEGLKPPNAALQVAQQRRLRSAPWTVFLYVPKQITSAQAAAVARETLIVGALVLVAALLLGVALSSTITRPIRDLAAATRSITGGDLAVRVPEGSLDELGSLGRSFNAMAAALATERASIEARVQERTEALRDANAELEAQAEELRVQQDELLRKSQELERADRMKSEFLANMSHELRTPLNAVIGFSELLLDDTERSLSPQDRKYAEDILASGRHLLALINDILDLARIESGRMAIQAEPVDPAGAVAGALTVLASEARKRGIAPTSEIATRNRVLADPFRLRQILLNLLSNAIKFTPEGGRVSVTVDDEGARVRFRVRDSGPGIEPALAPRLFQPFVQGDHPLVKRHQGTGLGLAITKRLVEAHGGRIEWHSTPQEGTTFDVLLPVAVETGGAPAPSRPVPAEGSLILVVDDDPSVAPILRGAIEGAGYLVREAATAREGFEVACATRPAAIVVDLVLPDQSGYDLIERLAADPRTGGVPVVVLTAADPSEAEVERLRRHAGLIARKGDLTRAQVLAALERATGRTAPPPSPGASAILVVDDHDMNRELVRRILERMGYRVLQAASGAAALENVARERPALILLDIAMPGMDGYDVVRRLKADEATRTIPVVALTALAMRGDEDKARFAGFDAYLTKPIERPALEGVLRRFVPRQG